MSKEQERIKFHPGFYGAAELEFRHETVELEFHVEYNLSKEPLRVDLLIIGKEDDLELQNEIGKIFKRHNIIEYKSPDDVNARRISNARTARKEILNPAWQI